jgi:hypothetical protein
MTVRISIEKIAITYAVVAFWSFTAGSHWASRKYTNCIIAQCEVLTNGIAVTNVTCTIPGVKLDMDVKMFTIPDEREAEPARAQGRAL